MSGSRISSTEEVANLSATLARFRRKVDASAGPEGCWLWTGYACGGYGQVSVTSAVDGRTQVYGTHRMAYVFAHGSVPEGLVVRHVCPGGSNSLCCNPSHLAIGTHQENAADRDREGHRFQPITEGADHPSAKLAPADVLRIRATPWRHGMDSQVARELGVSSRIVGLIRAGKRWSSIPMPGKAGWIEVLLENDLPQLVLLKRTA